MINLLSFIGGVLVSTLFVGVVCIILLSISDK